MKASAIESSNESRNNGARSLGKSVEPFVAVTLGSLKSEFSSGCPKAEGVKKVTPFKIK